MSLEIGEQPKPSLQRGLIPSPSSLTMYDSEYQISTHISEDASTDRGDLPDQ